MAGIDRSDALITALAAGRSVVEAAVLAGMSERTAYRRLEDPELHAAIRARRADLFAAAAGRLSGGLTVAVDALVRNLDAEQPATQIRAAVAVLDQALKLRQSEDLERRVAELEAALAERGDVRGAA